MSFPSRSGAEAEIVSVTATDSAVLSLTLLVSLDSCTHVLSGGIQWKWPDIDPPSTQRCDGERLLPVMSLRHPDVSV